MTYHKTGRTYVAFLRELKCLGFTQDYNTHSGGMRSVMFSREYPDIQRFVWVEFSGANGIHQMRLGRGDLGQYGRSSALAKHGHPVKFETVTEMLSNIILQITGKDLSE